MSKTVTLQEGEKVYKEAQINQLLSELDSLRAEKTEIIAAVKQVKTVMPFDEKGGLDPMKIMSVIGSLQGNNELSESLSFLGKYVD